MYIKVTSLIIVILLFLTGSVSCVKSGDDKATDVPDQSRGAEESGTQTNTPVNSSQGSPADNSGNPPDSSAAPVTNDAPPAGQQQGLPVYTQSIPANWPDSVPVMDGFTVTTGITDQPNSMLALTAGGEVPVDDVVAFYSNLSGWQKDENDPMVPWVTKENFRQLKLISGAENLTVVIQYYGKVDNMENYVSLDITYYIK